MLRNSTVDALNGALTRTSGAEKETAVTWCPEGDKLDQDIFDALSEFVVQLLRHGENLAGQFGVPVFCIKALHRLDAPVTMKELGRRMHCDPSFVTMIADTLEQRGLARREPNAADRRIKNLVLTEDGLALKARIERALLDQMPWASALDLPERKAMLAMFRKMNAAIAQPPVPSAPSAQPAGAEPAGEVSTATTASRPGPDTPDASGTLSEAIPAQQS
jgi:DNA-binding MarR family transcriptional regulator